MKLSKLITINTNRKMKLKLLIQYSILKLYESWVNILLMIVNEISSNGNHFNLGTPIQKNLIIIENYHNDNYKIKAKIVQERIK